MRYPRFWREFDEDFGKGWGDWYLQRFGYLPGWHGGPVAQRTAAAEAA